MATTVTKVVDPDSGAGYDYDSIFDWEAAQQGDLTGARNEIAVAKCRCTGGTADTTGCRIDGWTASATQYIKAWTDTAESYRHSGTYPSGNKYRLYVNGGFGECFRIEEDYVLTIGIAFRIHSYDVPLVDLRSTSSNNRVEQCVFSGDGVTTPGCGIITWGTNSVVANCFIENCVVGINCVYTNDMFIYNNTVRSCTTGITGHSAATCRAKNNIVDNCTTCYSDDFHGDSTNNAGSDTTAPGSNPVDSITVSFTATGDCHLAATGNTEIIGAAANLYNDATYPFQTDIDGQDRGGAAAAWDIGADEYVSAVADLSIFASECVGSEGMFG